MSRRTWAYALLLSLALWAGIAFTLIGAIA